MNTKQVNKDNFFVATTALFSKVDGIIEREADHVSFANAIRSHTVIQYISESKIAEIREIDTDGSYYSQEYPIVAFWKNKEGGVNFLLQTDKISSRYWYDESGVYRESDHWGNVRHCQWELPDHVEGETVIGFCKWEDFKMVEESEVTNG